jgi:hypothetical protein
MVRITFNRIIIILFIFSAITAESVSQTSYILNPESSKVTILGTSSLHDWEMEVRDIDFSTTVLIDGEVISGIQDTYFSCTTTSIVSDYKLMDKKTYEALKAEEFSSIEFKMINGKISLITGNEFSGTATGYLSIAGKTKEVNVPFSGNLLNDGQLDLEGKVNLKMSEFDIDPPKAMAGTLKTGDEVSIVYSLKLEKNNTGKQISEIKAGSSIVN